MPPRSPFHANVALERLDRANATLTQNVSAGRARPGSSAQDRALNEVPSAGDRATIEGLMTDPSRNPPRSPPRFTCARRTSMTSAALYDADARASNSPSATRCAGCQARDRAHRRHRGRVPPATSRAVVLVGVWTDGTAAMPTTRSLSLPPSPRRRLGGARGPHPASRSARSGDLHRFRQGPRGPGCRHRHRSRHRDLRRRAHAGPAAPARRDRQGQVIDRTALILDIFAQHARSKEGKGAGRARPAAIHDSALRGWVSRCPGRPAAGSPAVAVSVPVARRDQDRDGPAPDPGPDQQAAARDQGDGNDPQHKTALPSAAPDSGHRDRRLHQRRQVQPAQPADRRGRAGRKRAVCDPRPTVRRATTRDGREFTLTDTVGSYATCRTS